MSAAGAILFLVMTAVVPACGGKEAAKTMLVAAPTPVTTPPPSPTPTQDPVPTPVPPAPTGNACAVVSGVTGQPGQGIINGDLCSAATSPVVQIRLFDSRGRDDGSCTGTVISSHAVLTAAHCLSGVHSVIIDLAGHELRAASFTGIPEYRDRDPDSPDVGVIVTEDAIPRAPVPLLLSRDARPGDTGVIAGYGDDERGDYGRLKAGVITIAEVTARFLVAQYAGTGSNTCYGDSGGPLLMATADGYAIAGVTSGGDDDCSRGSSDFAKMTNGDISSFVLGLVPDAARR